MKYIEDIEIKNNKVILRLDLNVTIKDGVILDDTKIKKSIPTIKYILNTNSSILIMSHLGKVKTEEDKENNSLRIVSETLSNLLGEKVLFIEETRGSKLESWSELNNICLMENTRYEDLNGKLESGCDMELASYWASLGDLFVNDAFGTTHRRHASNYGISKYVTSAYGFLIQEELMGLKPIISDIEHPFTVVMGGAKVDDKVALIERLLEECDYLLVGGGIANTFLKAKSYNIGSSLYSADYVDKVRELIDKYQDKIWMPVDVVVKENIDIKIYNIEDCTTDSQIFDIGPKSVEIYSDIIRKSKTLFVNGTMGLYEEKEYRNGTEGLYKSMNLCDGNIIAGGGDAVASVNKLGYTQEFDFLSTGGGASLEYIATKKINCFED